MRDDEVLSALRAARPQMDAEPAADSAAAQALLARVLESREIKGSADRRAEGSRWWRWSGAVAAAAAVTALAFSMAPTAGHHVTARRPSPAPVPSAGALPDKNELRSAVLAAFATHVGGIAHSISTWTDDSGKSPASTDESWTYPSQVSAGQREQSRKLLRHGGRPVQDYSYSCPIPTGSGDLQSRRVPAVITTVDYTTRSWSIEHEKATVGECVELVRTPEETRSEIAAGRFTVQSRGELNGRPAILLWWKENPHDSSQLWVDSTTYLPIRSIAHQEGGMIGGPTFHTTIVTDYDILAPTPDNLARLHPPVPPGFPRVAHAEPTGS